MELQEAASLDSLKVQRSTIKGKLTRISNFVQNYNSQINSLHDVKARQAETEKITQKFDDVQGAIELLDPSPDIIAVHEQERILFEEKYYATKAHMDALLAPAPSARTSTEHDQFCTTMTNDTCSLKKPRVKLPQLELPRFSGDIQQWPAFKNIFMASVDGTDLPVVNKLQYLKSALTGEAAGLISSLLITEENYTRALEILNEMSAESRAMLVEVTAMTAGACRLALDRLLLECVQLGVAGAGAGPGEGEGAAAGYHSLTVQQVKVVDLEGNLKSVYPSRADCEFNDPAVRVTRLPRQ